MTIPAPTLANLGLYVLQAALLIAALALTIAAVRAGPVLRLAACRGVLLALILLPFQVLLRDAPPALPGFDVPARGVTLSVEPVMAAAGASLPWSTIVAATLATGVAVRAVWLAIGLARLRRLTRDLPGEPGVAATADIADLQQALGTQARVAFVDRVQQPVTFGVTPAVVVLPAALLTAPAARRRAILCHELLHVRRRDWLWALGEELALTILWFHPAAGWLVGELQLAREQVVDRLTVALTGARREYMDALFSAADLPSAPPLLSGFLRRRHLARRLVSLAEEVVMSRMRLVGGAASMAAVLVVGGTVGAAAWPLAPLPAAQGLARPVQETGERMAFVPRRAPVRVAQQVDVPFPRLTGEPPFGELVVDIEATLDANGGVTATKAATVTVHGPIHGDQGVTLGATPAIDAAVAGAVDTLRAWRFEAPETTPAAVLVRIRFAAETRAATVSGVNAIAGYTPKPVLTVAEPPNRIVNVQPIYPQEARDAKVQGIVAVDMTIDADGSVVEAWVTQSVPMLDEAALQAVKQWRFEPTLLNGNPVAVRATSVISFTLK